MNQIKNGLTKVHAVNQTRGQQAGQTRKPDVMQPKKPPVAPPVYSPHAKPLVAQRKAAHTPQPPPVAPPVYRPQQSPKVLQTKSSLAQSPHAGQAQPSLQPVRAVSISPAQKSLTTPTPLSSRGVVQRAQVARRGGGRGGGGGGGKKPPPNPYKDASQMMLDYNMAEDFQRWLRIGMRVGYPAPVFDGYHAGRKGKAGGKAEKVRNLQIARDMAAWKEGLLLYLAASNLTQETKLGRIETALGM